MGSVCRQCQAKDRSLPMFFSPSRCCRLAGLGKVAATTREPQRRRLMHAALFSVAILMAAQMPARRAAAQNFEQIAQSADAARTAGRIEEALQLYDRGVHLHAAWSDGWWWLGRLYYDQDRFPEAEAALLHFVDLAPNTGPAQAFLALCEYETRHYQRAVEHFRDWALAESPGSDQLSHAADLHWALLLTREGRFAEALFLFAAEAQKRGPGPMLIDGMGLAALRMAYLPEEYPQEQRERIWLAGESAFYASLNPPDASRSEELVREYSRHYGWRPGPSPLQSGHCPSTRELALGEKNAPQETFLPCQHVSSAPIGSAGPEDRRADSQAVEFEQLSHAARQALNENRSEEATRLYQQALKLEPDWPQGLWDLSTLLYDHRRYAEARNELRHFLTVAPNSGPGKGLLGLSEFQTREYARALDHLQQSTTLGLEGTQGLRQPILYTAALLLTRFEMYEQSLRLLFEIVRQGQPQPALVESAGLAALRMPMLPAEIPPDRREMVRLAGEGSLALWDQYYDQADQRYRQMATAYPNEPGVHFLYGKFLMNQHPQEGIQEMKRELEVSAYSVPARVQLAEGYVKLGEFDLALPVAEQAVELDPKAPSTHLEYGEALVAKWQLAAGIRELETAQGLDPKSTRVRWDLFRAYSAAGRAADASHEKEAIQTLSQPEAQP